ncbi:MAG TPA: hypothetical protein VJS12_20130 [Steroidobacteraceae bacterium]|nr:hypothetical protein [Steroidobacteraceae bacterium]
MATCTLTFVFTDWSRPWDRDEFETAIDSLTTLANGLISAIGIYWSYRANGGADGVQFAERIVAIGFVVFVRFVVFSVLAAILWIYAAVYFKFSFRPSLQDLDFVSLALVTLFWVRVRSHVASVAQPGT